MAVDRDVFEDFLAPPTIGISVVMGPAQEYDTLGSIDRWLEGVPTNTREQQRLFSQPTHLSDSEPQSTKIHQLHRPRMAATRSAKRAEPPQHATLPSSKKRAISTSKGANVQFSETAAHARDPQHSSYFHSTTCRHEYREKTWVMLDRQYSFCHWSSTRELCQKRSRNSSARFWIN